MIVTGIAYFAQVPVGSSADTVIHTEMFHSVLSPSALSLSAQHTAALWWPLYILMESPVDKSHSLALQSDDAVTK